MSEGAHRLAALLQAAARGRFLPADGRVEVLGAPPGRAMAVAASLRALLAAGFRPIGSEVLFLADGG